MLKRFGLVLAVGSSLMMAQVASAGMMNGTLGFVPVGSPAVTFTGADLGHATSITIQSLEIVNTVPTLFNGIANDFSTFAPVFSHVTVSPLSLTLPNPGIIPGYVMFGGFTFDLTGLVISHATANSLHFTGIGIMTGNGFDATAAQLSASFTSTGVGAANGSFTLSAPPTSVPETGTILVSLAPLALLLVYRISKLGSIERGLELQRV